MPSVNCIKMQIVGAYEWSEHKMVKEMKIIRVYMQIKLQYSRGRHKKFAFKNNFKQCQGTGYKVN